MKVLALGGPGAMGAVAVRTAARLPGIDEIVVADRDLDAAQRLAAELSATDPAVSARRVDVDDASALRDSMRDADVVLNTVGPYYRFGLTVLRAAIDTGTHYLDLCDDWEPTLRMLELDSAARKAGVCAVVGMGASPGVSNLLAVTAARELDSVENLYTAWPVDVPAGHSESLELTGTGGQPPAALVHWMEQISGTIAVVRHGRIAHEAPLRPVALALPGDRRGTGYTVGHPEPVTLQRTLLPSGEAANLMIVTPGTVAFLDVLRRDIDSGKLRNESAALELVKPGLRRGIRSLVGAGRFPGPGTLPPFFAAVRGSKDGRARVVLAQLADAPGLPLFIDDMSRATGIPLALGLAQLADGTARRPGVHPPESVIDPDRFFRDLRPHLGDTGDDPAVIVEHRALTPAH
ncbi:saccharopine dehydrogenase family protein [Nocardia seriolae]|uniref:Saccharopine dehydrogenase n=1 Tax=Nocardia seriolae TaxID=37332 RepID=A0A0B8NQ69_9NOCA|nr:saccharopine dehydrogenase NADP-binding domain-containing protein [Nocardia seriolae]APA97818.1 Saccharopine dehydrogenase (NAD(+), L-lysine-forming) [Nocardia seriolae]MTJ64424.1 saccharopine dehydrogenase [Nocardia seriolae]MTJ75384.1 saccharopine dehydrogenase [Nocardia seriolae]MTJ87581.1 saccharopine dehydrogenase [Nocardia seriolae]MTK31573.1 saccharopine dehydrogenase [Nocardia seriolae]